MRRSYEQLSLEDRCEIARLPRVRGDDVWPPEILSPPNLCERRIELNRQA
jgi:hypothetical protein